MPYRPLTELLERHFERLSPELQRAARWVSAHPAELGLQSMRQSALAAGVSPATMTRLAQALGLDGFEAMRRPSMQAFAQSVGQAPDLERATAVEVEIPATKASERLRQAQINNVNSVRQHNTPQQLNEAAQSILAARHVLFLGLRASFGVAYHLHYTCDWLRPDTRLAADLGGAWVDGVLQLSPADLLVVVSQAPYTRQTVDATQAAHEGGVPVLALTDSTLSPLARVAQQSLLFEAASPAFFHSMTGAQALAETLMDRVAELGGAAVVQRLADRQARLQASRAYSEKQRPPSLSKLS